jgi:enoyl-CoA hydratase
MNDILFERVGRLGKVTLNRPQALNALTHEMCVQLHQQLRAWAKDAGVEAVLIRGAGDRAFCAGGDVRKLYDEGKAGGHYPYDFYRDEYRLNAYIESYPKPYIALIDGIVMGGGVGVSVHGTHRVVTEKTTFAMPETGIGLFPDVGGSFFLSRCPGQTGRWLALTGARIKAADALHVGVGDAFTPSAQLDELEAALAAAGSIDATIARFKADPGPAPVAANRAAIDRCFAGDSVEAIIAACQADGSTFALECAAAMLTKSPTSLKITLRQVTLGKALDFKDCMRMEYRMACGCIAGYDFYEGVRAVVIDKDQKPKWTPPTLEGVSHTQVDGYFADLGPRELTFED